MAQNENRNKNAKLVAGLIHQLAAGDVSQTTVPNKASAKSTVHGVDVVLANQQKLKQVDPPPHVWAGVKAATIQAETQEPTTLENLWQLIRYRAPLSSAGFILAATVLVVVLNWPETIKQLPSPAGKFFTLSGQEAQSFKRDQVTIKTTANTKFGLTETDQMLHAFVKQGALTFSVAKSKQSTKPLTVWFPGGFIKTKATEFEIKTTAQKTEINLVSGKILVATSQPENQKQKVKKLNKAPTYKLQTLSGSGKIVFDFTQIKSQPKQTSLGAMPWPFKANGTSKQSTDQVSLVDGWQSQELDKTQLVGLEDLVLKQKSPTVAPDTNKNGQATKIKSNPGEAKKTVVVYLKNGNKITGQLTKQTETKITLKTPMGVLQIPTTDITKWEEQP